MDLKDLENVLHKFPDEVDASPGRVSLQNDDDVGDDGSVSREEVHKETNAGGLVEAHVRVEGGRGHDEDQEDDNSN